MERRFGLNIEHEQFARDAKWTALYQKGMPAFQIAEQEKLPKHEDPKQTVFRAVSRFSKSIGLNLRSRAGRKVN
jgi:crotonobetainyl-CoA:carnitine CoA-transferase CaiB-like acyl-CoA transferase